MLSENGNKDTSTPYSINVYPADNLIQARGHLQSEFSVAGKTQGCNHLDR